MMRTDLKAKSCMLLTMILGFCACAAVVLWKIHSVRASLDAQAQQLLREVAGLQVHQTMFEEVLQLVSKHGGGVSLREPNCTPNNCELFVTLENTPLYAYGLAPKARLSVLFQVHNSVLDRADIGLQVERSRTIQADVDDGAIDEDYISGNAAFSAHHVTRHQPEKRSEAFKEFNVRCLSRLGGCRSSHEILTGGAE